MGLARRWRGVLWTAVSVVVLWPSAASAASADEPKVAIGFSNLVARLEAGDEIGFADGEYRVRILEALRSAGLNAVGAESLVFSQDDAERADVLLGGTVKELACEAVGGQTNCRIGIAWEVLDRGSQRVVYRVLTRYVGQGVSTDNHAATGKRLVLGALASLLKHPYFAELTSRTTQHAPPDASYSSATFRACQAGPRELPSAFNEAADATVMIKNQQGFGSGFFLGPDGLLLTAAHVVAEGGALEVQQRNGAVLSARVLRISRRNDVALISVARAKAGFPCLMLDTSPKQPGSDVYAIGAPASQDLAFSLTRGIISGLRKLDDTRLIQTDASVSPGNSGGPLVDKQARVLAIVSRKLAATAVEGVAFGVPIEDALSALKLEPGAATAPRLLEDAGESAADTHASKSAINDPDDALPNLDPRGASAGSDVGPNIARRPAYIQPLRVAGLALATLGAVGVVLTYENYHSSSTIGISHADYESVRTKNDVSWAVLFAGGALIGASYVLDLHHSARHAKNATPVAVAAGPGQVRLDVRF